MKMSKNDTRKIFVYAESSSLFAALVPTDAHHQDVVKMLDEIQRRGFRIVVSLLTLMETFASIRRKSTTSNMCRLGSEEERAGVEAHVQNIVNAAFKLLDKLVKQGIIEIIEPENWSPDLLLLYAKLLEHAGYVLPVDKGRPFRHRAVGSYDWLHFALAKYLGAVAILTTDVAFADIAGNDDEFGHILIQLASEPLVGPLAAGAA